MKKIILSSMLFMSASSMFAQDIEAARLMMQLKQYDKAKTEIEKYLANEKNAKKADGWYAKAQIFLGMSYDEKGKTLVANPIAESITAFKKYVELDPSTKMMKEEKYALPEYLQQSLFSKGGGQFNAKQYADALASFKESINFTDFAKSKGLMPNVMDTASLFYGAVAASELKNNDEAMNFYKPMVDAKLKEYSGNKLDFMYEAVVDYYLKKNDETNFKKYLPIAREVLPTSGFLRDAELAFILNIPDFDNRMAKIEGLIAAGTKDEKLYTLYTSELFNFLNPADSTKRPANPGPYEAKLIDGAAKGLQAFPLHGNPAYNAGTHFYNQMILANREINAISKKKPVDPKAKAVAQKKYDDAMAQAIAMFDKAVTAYGANKEIKGEEKSNYKKATLNLSDFYGEKKGKAKPGSPDYKNFSAQVKKYDDLYSALNKSMIH